MSTLNTTPKPHRVRVIHPLDDVAEPKCSAAGLGLIHMTPTVCLSLRILRGYLVLMTLMLVYHVLDLAGVITPLLAKFR